MAKDLFSDEEEQIREVIIASRKLEEYLWGEYNGQWNIEEWRRMFRKRIQKIDDIINGNIGNILYVIFLSSTFSAGTA